MGSTYSFTHQIKNRNFIILYVGGDEVYRKITLMPRNSPIYNNIYNKVVEIENKTIDNTIVSSTNGDFIAVIGEDNDIDLIQFVQDGAELYPYQLVQLSNTGNRGNYYCANVTQYTNERDIEIALNNDSCSSVTSKENTSNEIANSILKLHFLRC